MALTSSAGSVAQHTASRALRNLYLLRAIFSAIWVVVMLLVGIASPQIGVGLLVIYPLWDAIATLIDLRTQERAENPTLHYVNIGTSLLTSAALLIAAASGVYWMIVVFGAWALIAGLIQLYVGVQRRQALGGQWAMILSGGQSSIAGITFMLLANAPMIGLSSLAGYAAFGAFYFLIAALRLTLHPSGTEQAS